ncbi:MAG TPA: hypothetical protein VFT62_04190 [Mycobacteriales bacterium]|nr:hypothetical protein [Mycobacteriales bacterium]
MSAADRDLSPEAVQRLTLDAEPWLSCDDCFEKIDEYVEQLLGGSRTLIPAMRAHLRGCGACRDEAESLVLLVAVDRGVDPEPALRELRR